jgi:threonine dehydrogenase-like Zn-dependent dehydrogenase
MRKPAYKIGVFNHKVIGKIIEIDEESYRQWKVGDRIWVMPPDRSTAQGWEATILKINDLSCDYQLTDGGEIFTVRALVIMPNPRLPKIRGKTL